MPRRKTGKQRRRIEDPRWVRWRAAVYSRDRFRCQCCGWHGWGGTKSKGQRVLHPHHIRPKALYPDLIYDVDNGVTLCERCHNRLHSVYGPISAPEEFELFLAWMRADVDAEHAGDPQSQGRFGALRERDYSRKRNWNRIRKLKTTKQHKEAVKRDPVAKAERIRRKAERETKRRLAEAAAASINYDISPEWRAKRDAAYQRVADEVQRQDEERSKRKAVTMERLKDLRKSRPKGPAIYSKHKGKMPVVVRRKAR